MPTKTVERTGPESRRQDEPSLEELEAARRIHTLAQMIYGRLTGSYAAPAFGAEDERRNRMFWQDPNFYGVNLPIRELTSVRPFMGANIPWEPFPRFVPPTYGFAPPYFAPPMTFNPLPFNPMTFNPLPFNPMTFNPYVNPQALYRDPFTANVPSFPPHAWYRPTLY